MGFEFHLPPRKTGLSLAVAEAGGFLVHGRFDLSGFADAVAGVELRGQSGSLSLTWQETQLRQRKRHADRGEARRILELGPANVDLAEGPLDIILRGDRGQELRLGQVDQPGMAARRFRDWLGRELEADLATFKTGKRLRRLVAAFATVPVSRDDLNWVESNIALCVLQRIKSTRTHAQIAELKTRREAAGEGKAFEAFISLLTEKNGLRLPTFHGYGKTFAERDQSAILIAVGRLMARLQALGLTVFANSGTLLGLVREGRLLGHDDDIDLAVVLQAKTPEAAAREWLTLSKLLAEQGLLTGDTRNQSLAILKLHRIEGVAVDLFPCWFDAHDQAHLYPHTKGDLGKADVLPLAPSAAADGLLLPANAPAMLEVNYGPNWRVPDPTFRFPWDDAHAHFAPFTGALAQIQDEAS